MSTNEVNKSEQGEMAWGSLMENMASPLLNPQNGLEVWYVAW